MKDALTQIHELFGRVEKLEQAAAWEAECLRIKKELATARKRKTLCKGPLSEKIDRAREVRQLEEGLRQHKLNYFSYSKPEL